MTLKVQQKDKAVDGPELGKTERERERDRLTVCCLASDESQFLNIFFANKFVKPISVGLLQGVC